MCSLIYGPKKKILGRMSGAFGVLLDATDST